MSAAAHADRWESVLTWLYVPGDRADRLQKALDSDADAVIIDLEDAVSPGEKVRARDITRSFLGSELPKPVVVRVNCLGSDWQRDDITTMRDCPGVSAVRIPKVASTDDVDTVAALLDERRDIQIQCLIESALGVERAFAIAQHHRVSTIGLGEADLRADVGARSDAGLAWARGRIVNAARAASLPAPAQSVFPHLRDDDGLARSCAIGRDLGFFGRAAIHPKQLPIILNAYLPTEAEFVAAQEVVAATAGSGIGSGSVALPDGRFVDAAVVAGAVRTLAVVEHNGTQRTT